MEPVKTKIEVSCIFKLDGADISLTFIDGKFESGAFPFSDRFDRKRWKTQSDIILKIEKIEKKLKKKKLLPEML